MGAPAAGAPVAVVAAAGAETVADPAAGLALGGAAVLTFYPLLLWFAETSAGLWCEKLIGAAHYNCSATQQILAE